MNRAQRSRNALSLGILLGIACVPVSTNHTSSVQRVSPPPANGALASETVAPLTLSPGSGGVPGHVVRIRGFDETARNDLLLSEGYAICDKNNETACAEENRKPLGVTFLAGTQFLEEGNTNTYYMDIPYSVDATAPDRQVVPVSILAKNGTGDQDDQVFDRDYRLEITGVTQVFNYLSAHATESDLAEQDTSFGALAFLPPDYKYAYATLRSGVLAVVDTDTDKGQQPAQIDLAYTRPDGNAMQVLQGTITGGVGFTNRTVKITSPQPKAIATGDFDEDGDSDLVVANSTGSTVSVFRGDGQADTVSFPNGSTITVGWGPSALAVGDVDKDGHVDIAVTLAGTTTANCSAVVLWGLGNGSFTTGSTISAGSPSNEIPTGIAIGSLDGDEYPELIVAKHERGSPNTGYVRALANQGAGTRSFASTVNEQATGNKPAGIVLADFNGDAKLDVATPDSGTNSVSVMLGDGQGSFGVATHPTVDAPPVAIVAGFLNDDGILDLATANDRSGNNDTVSILIGNGSGGFTNTVNFGILPNNTTVDAQPKAIVVGEWSEDEYTDLAVTSYGQNKIAAFANNSTNPGTFAAPATVNNLNKPWGLVSGQFDTQKEDVLYLGNPNKALDEGRNAGYGIVIVEYPQGSGTHYAFLSNHNQDKPRANDVDLFCPVDPQVDLKYIGKTVTVVRIDPAQFAPSNEQIANDQVVATIEVGCGPHGMDVTSNDAYIFVANEYSGTVSRINVSAVLSDLPALEDAFTPSDVGVDATIDVRPGGYPPTYPSGPLTVISRGIDIVEEISGAGGTGPANARAFVTVAYPNQAPHDRTKGQIAVIKNLTNAPTVEGWLHGNGQVFVVGVTNPPISLGGQPLGVHALLKNGTPSAVVVPKFDHPGESWPEAGIRLVVASGQWRDGDTAFLDIPTFSMVDVNFKNGSLYQHWVWPEYPMSQDCPIAPGILANKPANPTSPECTIGDPYVLSALHVSGSIASSSDGQRAYIARLYDAGVVGPEQAGVIVVDANPSPFARLTGNRLLGAIGQPEGVFSVARIPLTASQDAAGKRYKLYQGNQDSTTNDPETDYRGLWQTTEPLVIPKTNHAIVAGAFLQGANPWVFTSQNQVLARDTTIRSPKLRATEPKLAYWRAEFNASSVPPTFDVRTGRIAIANADGTNEQFLSCTDTSRCSCDPPTDCSPQSDGENGALLPAWSDDGTWLVYVRQTRHSDDIVYPDIIARRMSTGEEWNLTQHDHHVHADPAARFLSQGVPVLTVVFARDLGTVGAPTVRCSDQATARVQGIAKVDLNTSAPSGNLPITQLTFPHLDSIPVDCASINPQSQRRHLGDTDPDLSPGARIILGEPASGATRWLVFSRRFNEENVKGADDHFGNYDILAQTLDGSALLNLTGGDDGDPSAGCGQGPALCADQIPRWSPDSDRIAFALVTADNANDSDIYTIHVPFLVGEDFDRTNAQSSVQDASLDSSAAWYPDASKGDQAPDLIFFRTAVDIGIALPDLSRLYHPLP
ncbi:MAG: VCBS repeat-containing protein [bacterium]